MQASTRKAVGMADILLFIVDGQSGITPVDENFRAMHAAPASRSFCWSTRPTTAAPKNTVLELYRLGFDEAVMISAEHGLGIDELTDALEQYLPPLAMNDAEENDETFFAKVAKKEAKKTGKKELVVDDTLPDIDEGEEVEIEEGRRSKRRCISPSSVVRTPANRPC